ncbi:MAG: 3-ketoacyl-ACP reductase [Bacillota bacterium]|nr:3-ketoacyl-ACP reductase [Bacillota bacterium]
MTRPGLIALVTGSRRGIGLGIARRLASEGWHVVLSARSPEADQVLAEFHGAGWSAEYIPCDIADAGMREALLAAISERHGRLDLLVNNAGIAPRVRADLLDLSPESFDELIRVNTRGPLFLTQAAARAMLAWKRAGLENYQPRIVFITSVSADVVSTSRGDYCISKSGLSMVARLFAVRLASEGIPVFELRPGIIDTDMTAAVHDRYQTLIDDGLTPVPRFGQPGDVAAAVSALASGAFDFATGQIINIDGGLTIGRL